MSAELSSVLVVVGVFMLGVLTPGPNFLVVVERSMAFGFRAGVATGLGVAVGDAAYAAAGLAGLAPLISRGGWVFAGIKVLGGLYIGWIGWSMLRRAGGRVPASAGTTAAAPDLRACFRTGLMTDLANPKTIVFFASIFAMAYDPALSTGTLAAMWAGIVGSSIVWRVGLAGAFSRSRIRAFYLRWRFGVEAVLGSLLLLFGARMTLGGRPG